MDEQRPQRADLLLMDDILPLDFSPFRTIEYGHYLDFFDSTLLSLEGWHIHIANNSFAQALAQLPIAPELKSRVLQFKEGQGIVGRLAYVTFLHNAATLLPYFTERNLPFIMQLYPGGGFNLGQAETDDKLRRVLLSPLCRKVIVTQTVSHQYLLDVIGCDPGKIEFIYGGVFENRTGFDFLKDKSLYGRDKDTIDLCFVGHRYGNNLAAKGYDHFVTVACALAKDDPRLRFHVVGDYTAEDIPLGEAGTRFTFYGKRPSSFFLTFYPRMDAIISSTRPYSQGPGAFDGFPTGACMEAGFHGVLNCINDPLGLNVAFVDKIDIVMLNHDTDHSMHLLRELLTTPQALYDLAYSGWRKFQTVFDADKQLWARTRIIARELAKTEALIMRPRPRFSALDGNTDTVVSYLVDQCRTQADWANDTERRHAGLIRSYREQEERLEQALAQLTTAAALDPPSVQATVPMGRDSILSLLRRVLR